MGAPTEYYVDPSLGSDTGDGSVGTPWGRASGSVVQYALDTITRDAANGDRINVKAGTADVLGAALTLATYGTPTAAAPLTIQGYTAAAGDGGEGEIDGAGAYSIMVAGYQFIHLVDLHCTNSGTSRLLLLDDYCHLIRCRFSNCTNTIPVIIDSNGSVQWCHFALSNNLCVQLKYSMYVGYNYFSHGGVAYAIYARLASHIIGNVFECSHATGIGITLAGDHCVIANNSFRNTSGASTGAAIDLNTFKVATIYNNVFDDFYTDIDAGTALMVCTLHNKRRNVTTHETGNKLLDENNDALTSDPFDANMMPEAVLQAVGYPSAYTGAASTKTYIDGGAAQRPEVAMSTTRRNSLIGR